MTEQTYKMLLKDLISKNKILLDLLQNVPDKVLNHNINGIRVAPLILRNNHFLVALII